jgi:hypothetical protein
MLQRAAVWCGATWRSVVGVAATICQLTVTVVPPSPLAQRHVRFGAHTRARRCMRSEHRIHGPCFDRGSPDQCDTPRRNIPSRDRSPRAAQRRPDLGFGAAGLGGDRAGPVTCTRSWPCLRNRSLHATEPLPAARIGIERSGIECSSGVVLGGRGAGGRWRGRRRWRDGFTTGAGSLRSGRARRRGRRAGGSGGDRGGRAGTRGRLQGRERGWRGRGRWCWGRGRGRGRRCRYGRVEHDRRPAPPRIGGCRLTDSYGALAAMRQLSRGPRGGITMGACVAPSGSS